MEDRWMDRQSIENYIAILEHELVPALGCTEPIAIAYCSAKAREVLGEFPESVTMWCSGNIIKNVKAVTVPNSGGLKGIEVASVLGIVGGDPQKQLEVLTTVTKEDIEQAKELIAKGYCTCHLQEGVENLYIVAKVEAKGHSAEVTIVNQHTQIAKIVKDEEVLYEKSIQQQENQSFDKSKLNVKQILEFANCVEIERIKPILERQIKMNTAISREGLLYSYGAQVGRTLLEVYGTDIKTRARAVTAAGSDARMSGCSLPVVINSGSGNQGMTASLPVIEYAKELGVSGETLYRALAVSNLIAIHQKKYIGSLSAYCGAVSAACGSGAGITYMCGGTYEQVCNTIVNTIANVGGIVCDGAKSSCAAKIASAVEATILAHHMSMKQHAFEEGEGIVAEDIEETIKRMGYIGRVGMKETDVEILNLMLDKQVEE